MEGWDQHFVSRQASLDREHTQTHTSGSKHLNFHRTQKLIFVCYTEKAIVIFMKTKCQTGFWAFSRCVSRPPPSWRKIEAFWWILFFSLQFYGVQFLLIWWETVVKQRYTPNKGPSDRLNSDPLYSLRNPIMQSEVMQLPVNGGSTKPKSPSSPHHSAGGNLDEEIISFCYWHDNQGPIRRWAHLSSLLDRIARIHMLKTQQELYWHRSHQPLSHWVVISCLAIGHSLREHEEGSVPVSCLCL